MLLSGCSEANDAHVIRFAISAEYPPFEFIDQGKLQGFDIDLAKLIGKELGKEVTFVDMQFSAVLPTLQNGGADAAISTITVTPEREASFDFSDPYYTEYLASVYKTAQPITTAAQLKGQTVACQIGYSMEIWLKQHVPDAHLFTLDSNNHLIESLKAGIVKVVLIDAMQAEVFAKKNPGLGYSIIAQSDSGYAIAFKKGYPLKAQINAALKALKANGELEMLQQKWLGGSAWLR